MDFDKSINRKNTESLKWDKYSESVIPLWIADMDFEVDDHIKNCLVDLANQAIIGYSSTPKDLIPTFVQRMKDLHQWEIESDWVVILPGLVPGLHASNRIFAETNYSVMTSTPVYRPFLESANSGNGKLIDVPFIWQNDHWEMDFDKMEQSVLPDTKMYMLCNPHNPNGRVFSKEELTRLADFCIKHDLVLCSDEIHCDLILDKNKKHVSVAALNKEIEQRSITLLAPSKTFNIAGLGCSFAIIPDAEIRAKFQKAIYGIVAHPSSFSMRAALVAYRDCEPWRVELIKYLKENHDYLLQEINNHEGLEMKPLEATYLAWIKTDKPNTVQLLEQYGVGVQDAHIFGGNGYFRLNFATQKRILSTAIERIKEAFNS